jgi:flagellar motor switch protein FliM
VTQELETPPTPTASLVRSTDGSPAFPVLDRVGGRFRRTLAEALTAFGCSDARVSEAQASLSTFADWRDGQSGDGAICRFRLLPMNGVVVMFFPVSLVRQLVDAFYGGNGDACDVRDGFSTGELRFVERLGERCGAMMADAWADIIALKPQLGTIATDWSGVDWVRGGDQVVVQTFGASSAALTNCNISIIYSANALRTVSRRGEAEPLQEAEPVDAEWRDRLTGALLQTRLPLRTIFARPEMKLARLLTLKPGDIVPITLPSRVPVSVAGRLFAEATVGEANGRVAIRIEKMEGTSNE